MRNYARFLLFLLVSFYLSANLISAAADDWKLYDINKDGRFDKADIDASREKATQGFDNDINRDGKKDFIDVLYLYVKLSVLDRSCNGVVDDEDFRPAGRMNFPAAPDINTISALVDGIVSKSAASLPAGFEAQVFKSLTSDKALSSDEKAYVYQLVGITSLAKRNLNAAKWGFGKAHQIKDQSSLPSGNLAFCLAMEGRYNEALLLLSYARKIFPRSASTATTTGWIFARHGQNEEARKYYEEAVLFSPNTGQYHFNLGVILLRLGKNREAWEEFRKASELNPGDNKKFLFSYLTRPADLPPENKPATTEEIRDAVNQQINEGKKAGWTEDQLPVPWDQQSCCDQSMTIAETIEQKYEKQIEEMARSYSNDVAKKIEEVIKPYMPEWKDACRDWAKYTEGLPVVHDKSRELYIEAKTAASNERAALNRRMGAEILGYSSFFMSCALKEAENEYKTELEKWEGMEDVIPAKTLSDLKSEAYREALKNAMEQCYLKPMKLGNGHLTAPAWPYFNLPDPEITTIAPGHFYQLSLYIPAACLTIKGYCKDEAKCFTGSENTPEVSTNEVYSIDLWIISIEYDPESGEWEFNVDLGITLGATWTPTTGFGFQVGMDVSVGFIAGFEAGAYFKYDEGEWTYEETSGFYTEIGPFGYKQETSSSLPITAFQAVPEEPGSL